MLKKTAIILCTLLLFFSLSAHVFAAHALPRPAGAEQITSVIASGPSWKRFTNEDGTGLYHETLNAIFDLYGITVTRSYMPTPRSREMVRRGKSDMHTCSDKPYSGLLRGGLPMYEGEFYAFYNKGLLTWWLGQDSMKDKVVVWRRGYYSPANFNIPIIQREAPTSEAALGMVILGRADFYIDDINLIKHTLEVTTLEFNPDDFSISQAGHRQYYPLFTNSPQGELIKKMYDRGIIELYKNGTLQKIFTKWKFKIPTAIKTAAKDFRE